MKESTYSPHSTHKNIGDRYDPEVVEASIRKSYIFKLAEKGGKKKNDKKVVRIDEEEKKSGMLRSTHKPMPSKMGSSIRIDNKKGDSTYTLILSNIGKPVQTNFDCCSMNDRYQKVEAVASEFKELWVRNEARQEIYAFNFNTIKTEVKESPQLPHQIILNVSEKVILRFQSYLEDQSDFSKFKKDLKMAVSKGLGNKNQMTDLLAIPQFEKMKYKPVSEFAEHCETGDILLFQGSHFFAGVQRFLTSSQYDHVGMVIRDPIYGILIFESNSASGVCLTPWDMLIKHKWYKYIARIVWRKLEKVERDSRFISLVHDFVNANLGKNYFISFDKLLSNQSYIAKKTEEVGFFCSQLIATVYKDLDLLTRDQKDPDFKPSCNFYPYHFTQKFKMSLKKGQISPEFIIHFDETEVEEYYEF